MLAVRGSQVGRLYWQRKRKRLLERGEFFSQLKYFRRQIIINMTQEEITEFAKLLVQNVRDAAIKSADNQLYTTNMNSPVARRWRDIKNSGNIDKFGETIIVDTVDDTIAHFLLAIDEGLMNLSFATSKGNNTTLTNDLIGELSGWYMGEWRSEYSSERCSSDFDGLL